MRGTRVVVALLCCALAVAPPSHADDTATRDSEVVVSPGSESIEGELLVRETDGSTTSYGGHSSCEGCSWRLVPDCPGNAPGSGDELCEVAMTACSDDEQIRYRVYLRRAGETEYEDVGRLCLGGGRDIVSGGQLRVEVSRYLASLPLPAPGLQVQPAGDSVAAIPTICYADVPIPLVTEFGPLGVRVAMTATATQWHWTFGDGAELTTATPGAPWPVGGVEHAFARAGRYELTVTARWTATYQVVGQTAEIPVTGSVERTSRRTLTVREARTELIDGPR